jgi:SpoVK/Ycf46/Vps4 family AAA+-type ATPase
MSEGTSRLFELEVELPDDRLKSQSGRLIGFTRRYDRIRQDLRLLIDADGLAKWSQSNYGKPISILQTLSDRYPLVIFHGDVGTGKTATAEAVANALASELGKDARLFKLSTRVRGSGNVGEMSTLINQAFEIISKEAGKSKLSFLIIDEADSLAASRTGNQSHHEDKVAVNTLIQKIDDIRRFNGRVLVLFCTNRLDAIDAAIMRRAAYVEEFNRPTDAEIAELLQMDIGDLGFSGNELTELASLLGEKGPHKLAYTFSDIRTRVLPDALAQAFPTRKISIEDFQQSISKVKPSPSIISSGSTNAD